MKTRKRLLSVLLVFAMALVLAACNDNTAPVLAPEETTSALSVDGTAASEISSEASTDPSAPASETSDPSAETESTTENATVVSTETQATTPAAPVKRELKVTDAKGLNTLTFHTNGTYDFSGSGFYLYFDEYAALRALKLLATKEQKEMIAVVDGREALGPINTSFAGDGYTVSGSSLKLGNAKKIHVALMDWDLEAISTVTVGSGKATIKIIGDNGTYTFELASFTIDKEQAASIGLVL